MEIYKVVMPILVDISQLILAFGVLIAVYQFIAYRKELVEDHERSRRENTINLMLEWNKGLTPEMAETRKFIETLTDAECRNVANHQSISVNIDILPNIIKYLEDEGVSKKSEQESSQIDLTKEQVAKIRFLSIQYLNLLETILVAWQSNSVDRDIIERQFKYLLSPEKGHAGLDKFRKALGGDDAYPTIEVFINSLISDRNEKLKALAREKLGQNSLCSFCRKNKTR